MTGQSKKHSLIEAMLNTFLGFWIAVMSQYLIFPLFNIYVPFSQHVYLGLFFTGVSIVRSYYMRRFFNYLHIQGVL